MFRRLFPHFFHWPVGKLYLTFGVETVKIIAERLFLFSWHHVFSSTHSPFYFTLVKRFWEPPVPPDRTGLTESGFMPTCSFMLLQFFPHIFFSLMDWCQGLLKSCSDTLTLSAFSYFFQRFGTRLELNVHLEDSSVVKLLIPGWCLEILLCTIKRMYFCQMHQPFSSDACWFLCRSAFISSHNSFAQFLFDHVKDSFFRNWDVLLMVLLVDISGCAVAWYIWY